MHVDLWLVCVDVGKYIGASKKSVDFILSLRNGAMLND